MGHLRINICGPGNMIRALLAGQTKEHRPDQNARVVASHMGELQTTGHIARSVNALVGDGPQVRSNLQATTIMGNVAFVQIQLVDIHLAPDSHQQMRPAEITFRRVNCDGLARTTDLFGLCLFDDLNAFGPQIVQCNRRQLRVILAQRLHAFDNGHLGSKPRVGLRHFQTNRATANDNQMLRLLTQIKDVFVGVVGDVFQPRDRWNKRSRPRRHHKTTRFDDRIAGLNFGL